MLKVRKRPRDRPRHCCRDRSCGYRPDAIEENALRSCRAGLAVFLVFPSETPLARAWFPARLCDAGSMAALAFLQSRR